MIMQQDADRFLKSERWIDTTIGNYYSFRLTSTKEYHELIDILIEEFGTYETISDLNNIVGNARWTFWKYYKIFYIYFKDKDDALVACLKYL
jgi:hypothetical protein